MAFTVTAWISYVQYGIVLAASRFVNDLFIVDALMALEMKLNILGGTGGFMLFLSIHVHTIPYWAFGFHFSTAPHKQTVKPRQANAVQQRHNCFHNSIIDNTITRRLLKVYYEIELNRWLLFDSLSDDHQQNLMGNGQIWWETAKSDWNLRAKLLSHTLNWDRAGQTQTGIVRAGARTGLAVR